MNLGDSLLVSVLGMAVVFVVLVILNVLIKGISVLSSNVEKRRSVD